METIMVLTSEVNENAGNVPITVPGTQSSAFQVVGVTVLLIILMAIMTFRDWDSMGAS